MPTPAETRPGLGALALDLLTGDLADVDRPVVGVIAPGRAADLRQRIEEVSPRARVESVDAAQDEDAMHLALALAGPCDVLIDRGAPATPARAWRLAFHVRPGGAYLARLPERARSGASRREEYQARLHRRFAHRAEIRLHAAALHLTPVTRVRPIIHETQSEALLAARPGLGTIRDRRPAVTWTRLGQVRESESDHPTPPIEDGWSVPELVLREYRDVTSHPGQVLTNGPVVLPGTYRHSYKDRPSNVWMERISARFQAGPQLPPYAVAAGEDGSPRELGGTYVHLDNEFRGHFGHAMTDVLAKVWAWRWAKKTDPAAKALIHANKRAEPATWERQLLAAAGVGPDDLVYTRGPVRVERLISATQMLAQPRYAHPEMAGIWREIGDRLLAQAVDPPGTFPERIFVGRGVGNRPCHNAAEVESFFADLGFTVVYPEQLSLPRQVRLFRDARVIAGFAGSGMFGLQWATAPVHAVLVTAESYVARNEHLISGLLGHDVDIAWCRSAGNWLEDRARWQPGSFHAGFRFDADREGRFIRDVLARS